MLYIISRPVFHEKVLLNTLAHLTIRNLLSGAKAMTPAEIEQKMDELACKYVEAHDPDIQTNFIVWPVTFRRQ